MVVQKLRGKKQTETHTHTHTVLHRNIDSKARVLEFEFWLCILQCADMDSLL